MIIRIPFEDTELHQYSYERVHQAPGGCALAAAATASADVEVIGELIHLISPLLEASVSGDRPAVVTQIGGTRSMLVGSDLHLSQTSWVRVRKSW